MDENERVCDECGGPVDADGDSRIECWGSGEKCEECFGCYCDSSC